MLGDLSVWYLFLAGAGAGALVAAAVLEQLTPLGARYAVPGPAGAAPAPARRVLAAPAAHRPGAWRPRPRRLAPAGALIAPAVPREALRPFLGPAYGAGLLAVLLGMACLLADLGRPDRLIVLLTSPTPSYIAVGAYLLGALVLCALAPVAQWALGMALPRGLAAAARVGCVAAGVAVMAYTGLFLASLQAIAFWHSPWLPALFVASAASSGLGLLTGAVALGPAPDAFQSTLGRVRRADAAAIVVEAALLAALIADALVSGDAARASAAQLVGGALAPSFWLLVVGLGLIAPLAAELAVADPTPRAQLAVAACLLAGGLALRWCVVQAATAPDVAAFVAAALGMG